MSEQMVEDLLREIDRYGCESFHGSARCSDPGSGRVRGSDEGATAWCHPCLAHMALSELLGQRQYGSSDVDATVSVTKALLRDRLGFLAAQANDTAIDQAAHDAQVAVTAIREAGARNGRSAP